MKKNKIDFKKCSYICNFNENKKYNVELHHLHSVKEITEDYLIYIYDNIEYKIENYDKKKVIFDNEFYVNNYYNNLGF